MRPRNIINITAHPVTPILQEVRGLGIPGVSPEAAVGARTGRAGAQDPWYLLQALTWCQIPTRQLFLNESWTTHLSFRVISLEIFNSHWREGKSSFLKTIPVYSFTALVTAVCPGQHGVLSIFPIKDPSSPHSTQTTLVSCSQKWPWCPFASSLTYIFLIKEEGREVSVQAEWAKQKLKNYAGAREGHDLPTGGWPAKQWWQWQQ